MLRCARKKYSRSSTIPKIIMLGDFLAWDPSVDSLLWQVQFFRFFGPFFLCKNRAIDVEFIPHSTTKKNGLLGRSRSNVIQ